MVKYAFFGDVFRVVVSNLRICDSSLILWEFICTSCGVDSFWCVWRFVFASG